MGVLPSLPWLPSLFSIWTAPTYFFSWTLRTSFSLEDNKERLALVKTKGRRGRAVRNTIRDVFKDTLLKRQTQSGICNLIRWQIPSGAVKSSDTQMKPHNV